MILCLKVSPVYLAKIIFFHCIHSNLFRKDGTILKNTEFCLCFTSIHYVSAAIQRQLLWLERGNNECSILHIILFESKHQLVCTGKKTASSYVIISSIASWNSCAETAAKTSGKKHFYFTLYKKHFRGDFESFFVLLISRSRFTRALKTNNTGHRNSQLQCWNYSVVKEMYMTYAEGHLCLLLFQVSRVKPWHRKERGLNPVSQCFSHDPNDWNVLLLSLLFLCKLSILKG